MTVVKNEYLGERTVTIVVGEGTAKNLARDLFAVALPRPSTVPLHSDLLRLFPDISASVHRAATEYPKVAGECPNGCGKTLFLAAGGHVTCSSQVCSVPLAAHDLLRNPSLLKITEQALRERNDRLGMIERLAQGKPVRFPPGEADG